MISTDKWTRLHKTFN